MKLSRVLRIAPCVAAFTLAVSVAMAPSAAAEVVDVAVIPGLSTGTATPYGVGCTYLVIATTADVNHNAGVSFVDFDQASTFAPQNLIWDTVDPYFVTPVIFDHAFALWTPTAPGQHAIMAYQTSAGGPVETVMVNPATPLGPACLVAP